jgi:hypothetical protein
MTVATMSHSELRVLVENLLQRPGIIGPDRVSGTKDIEAAVIGTTGVKGGLDHS